MLIMVEEKKKNVFNMEKFTALKIALEWENCIWMWEIFPPTCLLLLIFHNV